MPTEAHSASAPARCAADADWSDPAPPEHVFGNTWLVGTCAISAILVTSDQGHVLIDGATDKAAAMIEANIRRLGFKVEDVRYLLNSHEHLDHAGGLARLQHDTGARLVAREPAAAALERGHGDRSDPQFLSAGKFPPTTTVTRIADGETIRVGTTVLTAHATPGHTPGSTSWTWQSCADERCLDVVYADSLNPISDDTYRFSDEAAHPGVLAAFRQSIDRVARLPCDILLTPHPGGSDMQQRIGVGATEPLIDAQACRRYAEAAAAKLAKRVSEEARVTHHD